MRTYEERLAEISRRSEKIKLKRKRRRKTVLAVCVPLLLCVSLSLVFLPPRTEIKYNEAAPEAMQEPTVPAMFYSYLCSVSRIDVSGQDISISLTDSAKIEKITNHLHRCGIAVVEAQSASGSMLDVESNSYATRGESIPNDMLDSVSRSYTLTLMADGKSPVRYSLSQTTLTDLSSGELHTLTQSQASVLYQLLGLPQP